jgi:seryl-tRNA synthetase
VALGILDAERATKLAGARFPLLLGAGARLARALAALLLDSATLRGYIEVAPPHLLRPATLEATGHLPHFTDDLFSLPADQLYLSPTAEVQLVGLHAGETLPEARLPLAYTACAPAFRREAGSAGRATRGLLRQHQFDEVELVRITTPEDADAAFDTLRADAEAALRALELPYRVVALCAGELPFSAQRTHDLEVWLPGQHAYVEISSISDCGPFQARRARLRYRPTGGGRPRYPHTLNGTALAIGRTLAALLENGQRADGSVALPAALAAYAGFAEINAVG